MTPNRRIFPRVSNGVLAAVMGLFVSVLLTSNVVIAQKKQGTKTQANKRQSVSNNKQATSVNKKQKTSAKPKSSKPQAVKPQSTNPKSAQQLAKLRSDIERDRAKLREVKRKERQVSSKLEQFRQKDQKLNGALRTLNSSLSRVQDSLNNAARRMSTLAANAAILRREYADLVYAVSRSDAPTTDEMMLGAVSMQETALWEGTMQQLSRMAGKHVSETEKRRDSLARVKENLVAKREQAAALKAEQEAEKNKVQSAISDKKQELQSVQADKQELIRHLEERNASARKLESMIGKLVSTSEGGRSPNPAMMKNSNKGDDNSKEQASIEARAASARNGFRRHSLPWPTDNHLILHKFGRYTNPGTGTLIENLGIGIAAKSGSSVRAVAKGTVSLVNWLPGYGSLVIIDHGNTFRTVYANLASVSIQQGQTVTTGAVLGRSGRSVDGEYLHFELWHDRDKLNPTAWLE